MAEAGAKEIGLKREEGEVKGWSSVCCWNDKVIRVQSLTVFLNTPLV